MAPLLFWVQLLFAGTLTISAQAEVKDSCELLLNATRGNFNVTVTPKTLETNTTYEVTISDTTQNVTQYLLQALSPQNISLGDWKGVERKNCTAIDTAVLNATQNTANWTYLDSNISSVEIRAYVIVNNTHAKLNTWTLSTESTTAQPATTPNSVPRVQSSSLFMAATLLLLTSKLLY